MRILLIIILFISQLFSDNFHHKEHIGDSSLITFKMNEFNIDEKEGYHHIVSESKGSTQNYGHPELPTFSFNYSIENNKDYEVEYTVSAYEVHDNINLYPSQPIEIENPGFIKDQMLYSSMSKYPFNNIEYERQSIRQYEMLAVTFIPFEYNFLTKQLKVYTDVELKVVEKPSLRKKRTMPRSKIFETMYSSQVINDFDYRDIGIDLQQPSILYICGGNAGTSDYYILEPLIEWRRQQGYEVNVVSLNQIGSTTTNIKDYISDSMDWDNPPEFICFVGDAYGSYEVKTYWIEEGNGWSSAAYGEGDHPYALLTGDDLLADVLLGRISIRTQTHISTIVNKIIGYEKNINPLTNVSSGTDWQNRAALVGDADPSGISTIITNEYINSVFNIHGGIDDVRTLYGECNTCSSWDNWMRDQFDDGLGYFNYRGIYGFSGFSENDIDDLENGYKLPFVTTLTCATGSFYEENNSTTEALVRAGTAVNPRGAVAAIGIAQSFTHTLFNNIVDMGIYESLFIGNAKTAGESLIYGKLALNDVYPNNPNNNVYLFSVWNNLIGDPATHLWKSNPEQLFVSHNDTFINGSNNFQVSVETILGRPVDNAIVTLYSKDNLQLTEITDHNGIADFSLDYNNNYGSVIVTTRAQDYIPVQTIVDFSDDLPEVTLNENSILINDTNGNNDGIINPSETIELSFSINNNSGQNLNNVNVDLSSISDYIAIENGTSVLNNINANSSVNVSGLKLIIDSYIPDDNDNKVRVSLLSDNLKWDYEIPLDVSSANLVFDSVSILNDDNGNGQLDRGESGDLKLSFINNGSMDLFDVNVNIDDSDIALNFNASNLTYSNIPIGDTVSSSNQVGISIDNQFPDGTIINIPIEISSSNGFTASLNIPFQVGEVSVSDPLGPDSYGYYIYDQNDSYSIAPDYNWIEIDPTQGGNGNELGGIYDPGDNNDDVVTIDLPFTFRFYGQEYDKASISSNGWLAFGETDMESFRNYPLPGPGGPPGMVAVFWDDLKAGSSSTGGVYTYYNNSEGIFIVEWSNVKTFFDNTNESFQIILYDTPIEQTATGDGEIKLQYKDFNNTSYGSYPVGNNAGTPVHGQYCTVGIENHTGTVGLEYTYNNVYPEAAMVLQDQRALLITTGPVFISDVLLGDMNNDGIINILDIIAVVNIVLVSDYESTADLNGDNVVNVLDIIAVVNITLGS